MKYYYGIIKFDDVCFAVVEFSVAIRNKENIFFNSSGTLVGRFKNECEAIAEKKRCEEEHRKTGNSVL